MWSMPETAVAFPALPHVIPKRIDRFFGMEGANGFGPTLREKALIRGAAFRLQQGVAIPGIRRVDVEVGRHDVVVTSQHHRCSSRVEVCRVDVQALQPSEFVIEFGSGVGVSVGSVNRGDEHAVGADIADRGRVRRNWADRRPTRLASGRTAVRALAVLPLR